MATQTERTRLSLELRIAVLEDALTKIEEWKPPQLWDRVLGRYVSYGALRGSNGERDYHRQIARDALANG